MSTLKQHASAYSMKITGFAAATFIAGKIVVEFVVLVTIVVVVVAAIISIIAANLIIAFCE